MTMEDREFSVQGLSISIRNLLAVVIRKMTAKCADDDHCNVSRPVIML